MSFKSKTKIEEWERFKILEIQKKIGESLSDVNATYQNCKAFTNRFERMCRKYNISPSLCILDKKTAVLKERITPASKKNKKENQKENTNQDSGVEIQRKLLSAAGAK